MLNPYAVGNPPYGEVSSITAAAEFVVPRSMPRIFACFVLMSLT